MGTLNRLRSAVPGITTGVLLALWVWPATHWLIVAQTEIALPGHTWLGAPCPAGLEAEDRVRDCEPLVEIAAHQPDDFQLQLAAAIAPYPARSRDAAAETVQRLRAMEQRFPDRPSVYANALRFACLYEVVIQRNEPAMLVGDSGLAGDVRGSPGIPSPEQLAAFDRDASSGERLEPNNAYFPIMRAVGLFAARRDKDALAEILRAGSDSSWHEYWNDELDGECRTQEE